VSLLKHLVTLIRQTANDRASAYMNWGSAECCDCMLGINLTIFAARLRNVSKILNLNNLISRNFLTRNPQCVGPYEYIGLFEMVVGVLTTCHT